MPDSKHSCPLDAFPNIWSFHTFLFRSFDPHPPSHGLGKVLKIIFFGHIFLYFCPVCDMYITNRLWFTPGPLCLSFGVMSLKSIEKRWIVCLLQQDVKKIKRNNKIFRWKIWGVGMDEVIHQLIKVWLLWWVVPAPSFLGMETSYRSNFTRVS